jgi:hypothetical protein
MFKLEDVQKAIDGLSEFNQGDFKSKKNGKRWHCRSDVSLNRNENILCVSGSYGISGQYAEGMVLNLLLNLQKLGYIIEVYSSDWEYGKELKSFVENN